MRQIQPLDSRLSLTYFIHPKQKKGNFGEAVKITVFRAEPDVIYSSESSKLIWRTKNAVRCSGRGGWSGEVPVIGEGSLEPLWQPTEFVLHCEDERGNIAESSIWINVIERETEDISPEEVSSELPSLAEVAAFEEWAEKYGIILQGISAKIDDLYYNRYDPDKDNIPLENVPMITVAHKALKLLPEHLLKDIVRGSTIYLSRVYERPFTVYPVPPSYEGDGILDGVNEGVILPQPISAHNTIHEIGHLVSAAIEDFYDIDTAPKYEAYLQDYNKIFDTSDIEYDPSAKAPPGYLSTYASANKEENFAEHFTFYITDAERFRDTARENNVLFEKYNFLRDKIFQGVEY